MTSAGGILSALGALTLGLDAYAVRKVWQSPFYESGQRYAQTALILCAPLIGAYLVLFMAREEVPMFQKPPVEHVSDIDPNTSDVGHDGADGT